MHKPLKVGDLVWASAGSVKHGTEVRYEAKVKKLYRMSNGPWAIVKNPSIGESRHRPSTLELVK